MGKRQQGESLKVAAYEMSMHVGLCMGVVDAVHEIYVGEKSAWTGFQTSIGTISIDAQELFGGEDKEGGVLGSAYFFPGNTTQTTPEAIAAKFGLTTATCPGFRGYASLYFGSADFSAGFVWALNNPYLKDLWVKLRRAPIGLDSSIALIPRCDDIAGSVSDATGFRFIDGFDMGTVAHMVGQSGSTQFGALWHHSGVTTGTDNLVTGRDGVGQAVEMYGTASQGRNWYNNETYSGIGLETSMGAAVKLASSIQGGSGLDKYQIMALTSGGNNGFLTLFYDGSDSKLKVYHSVSNIRTQAGATLLATSDLTWASVWQAWAFMEMHAVIDASVGTVKVYIDGVLAIDFTGDTTVGGTPIGFTICAGWASSTDRIGTTFDDVYFKTGGPLGPSKITLAAPTADVESAGWTPLSTGGTLYDEVDERPADGVGSYIEVVDTSKAAFTFGALAFVGPIAAVAIQAINRNADDSSGIDTVFFISDGASVPTYDEQDAQDDVNTAYGLEAAIWDTDPVSVANWTPTLVNSIIAGLYLRDAAVDTVRTTAVGVAVLSALTAASTDELDANPAHIIYECLTNTDWGMGAATGTIDFDNFEAVATVLYNAGFGISMLWNQQSRIEDFIQEVLDHIQATVFIHPRTGLWTIKLIRDDYTESALPIITADNCTVQDFQRVSWGDTVNELVVSWTNPVNEEQETVTFHDLANISLQGSIVSDSRNYYGVRCSLLAMTLAARDMRTASIPLAAIELTVDRDAADFVPGGVFKLTYPEHGLSEFIVRIMNVNYGRPMDRRIKLSVVEDVFAFPASTIVAPTGSAWVDPTVDPTAITNMQGFTQPAYIVENFYSDLETIDIAETRVGVLAEKDNADAINFLLMNEQVLPSSDLDFVGIKYLNFATTYTVLATALVPETESTLAEITSANAAVSDFVLLGSGSEATDIEWVLVTSFDTAGSAVVQRGCLDTVPLAHAIGAVVWHVGLSRDVYDPSLYADSAIATFKLLMKTSGGLYPEASAAELEFTPSDRPHLPLRPANVAALGQLYGTVDASMETSGTMEITWSIRNRLTETAAVLGWEEAGVAEETNQTTTIYVMDLDKNILQTHDGEVGSSYVLALSEFAGAGYGYIRVTSKRDGLESLQGKELLIKVNGGWGLGYGLSWGS